MIMILLGLESRRACLLLNKELSGVVEPEFLSTRIGTLHGGSVVNSCREDNKKIQ